MIKAVMFDFGATLILDDRFDYFSSLRKVHKVLEDAGMVPAFEAFEQGYLQVRDRLWSNSEFKEHTYNYRLAEVLKLFGHSVLESDKRLLEATDVWLHAMVDSFYMEEYVPTLLKQLHSRYKLAVVSNLGISEVVPITLEKVGIREYFDVILASGTVGYRKPSPVIFKEALRALGTLPAETVFVGDSLYHDVQGANALGIITIWLKRNNQTNENASIVPNKTIEDLKELPETLQSF